MSNVKLETAKEKLSKALAGLEKEIFTKIVKIDSSKKDDLESEGENEELRIKNEKLEESNLQKKEIIRQIKIDLSQIKKIIDQ